MCQIDVDQFYGIELGEFPARIAEIALWMMDHIMNNKLSLEFGESYVRIPLKKSPHIRPADALEMDWAESDRPGRLLLRSRQSALWRRKVPKRKAESAGAPDSSPWRQRRDARLRDGMVHESRRISAAVRARVGFVATNSITQGEQVAQLWPVLFDRYGLEISFAHRTFAWGSDARGMAHVHVVIIGLTRTRQEPPVKRLFSYSDIKGDPTESRACSSHAVSVRRRHCGQPSSCGGRDQPPALRYAAACYRLQTNRRRPLYFLGGRTRRVPAPESRVQQDIMHPYRILMSLSNGGDRWILYLDGASRELRAMPAVRERIAAVRAFRLKSKSRRNPEIGRDPDSLSCHCCSAEPVSGHPGSQFRTRGNMFLSDG